MAGTARSTLRPSFAQSVGIIAEPYLTRFPNLPRRESK